MNQDTSCKTVQELTAFLQSEYNAAAIEPIDYLLYNARQQVLNLFYPQQMERMMEQSGFSPEMGEEESAAFDQLTETFDRETACSQYVQYTFDTQAPDGAQARFYVTIEEKTGFVLPQFEWIQEEMEEVSEEDYRFFNRIMRDIVLYQGVSDEDIRTNSQRYQRYLISIEFWDSVCE